MLIDTHAHIYLPEFHEDMDAMLHRAKQAGIEQILLPNVDLESVPQLKALVKERPETCIGMMGLHPCSVKEDYREVLSQIEAELRSNKDYIAVGEIGIDLYWDKTLLQEQKEAFKIQINWAKELNLPIAIHARDSFDEIFEVLDETNDETLRGVLHCFTGNVEQAHRVLNYGGFKLGIGGVATFKNSGLDKTLAELSLDDLIVETDAPYLAPTPNRGKRNEPSYVRLVAQKLAQIYGETEAKIEEVTTLNAKQLFGLS